MEHTPSIQIATIGQITEKTCKYHFPDVMKLDFGGHSCVRLTAKLSELGRREKPFARPKPSRRQGCAAARG